MRWADLIFVMEKRHRTRLREAFPEAMHDKTIVILDIPDDYEYMDPELVRMLEDSVRPYLDDPSSEPSSDCPPGLT